MTNTKTKSGIGLLLKQLLKEQSMSMRKLSKLTDIDTATISRIISGKRRANLQHLQKLADCLGVPISDLLLAAGYSKEMDEDKQYSDDIHSSIDSIQIILKASEVYDEKFTIKSIEQQLDIYQQFAQTEEGKETIINRFEEKLQKVGSIGPFIDHLKDMFLKFKTIQGTACELAIIGGALMYFISPVDVIPDFIFPIGYLDDAIVVKIVIELLAKVLLDCSQVSKVKTIKFNNFL
jgi:uncharacterized membrane protein YkvA (DUF1232 family)/DNA-binding Xre family transcriptional regulator